MVTAIETAVIYSQRFLMGAQGSFRRTVDNANVLNTKHYLQCAVDLVEINPSCKHYVYIQFTFCRSFQFVLSLSLFLSLSFFCLYLMLFFVLELLLLRVAWFELLLLLFVFVFFAVSEFCFTSANFTCDSCKTVQDCRNGRRFGTGFRCDRRWQSNEIMGIVDANCSSISTRPSA